MVKAQILEIFLINQVIVIVFWIIVRFRSAYYDSIISDSCDHSLVTFSPLFLGVIYSERMAPVYCLHK